MLRRRALLALLCVLALGSFVYPRAATWFTGAPWPHTIHIYDESEWPQTVRQGMSLWNDSGANVRFVRVATRAEADVVIVSDERVLDEHTLGRATIGYQRFGQVERMWLKDDPDGDDALLRAEEVRVVVHELGHVIGLTHSKAPCEVMYPTISMPECDPAVISQDEQEICGPQSGDVRRVIAMYGGRERADRQRRCPSTWEREQALDEVSGSGPNASTGERKAARGVRQLAIVAPDVSYDATTRRERFDARLGRALCRRYPSSCVVTDPEPAPPGPGDHRSMDDPAQGQWPPEPSPH